MPLAVFTATRFLFSSLSYTWQGNSMRSKKPAFFPAVPHSTWRRQKEGHRFPYSLQNRRKLILHGAFSIAGAAYALALEAATAPLEFQIAEKNKLRFSSCIPRSLQSLVQQHCSAAVLAGAPRNRNRFHARSSRFSVSARRNTSAHGAAWRTRQADTSAVCGVPGISSESV